MGVLCLVILCLSVSISALSSFAIILTGNVSVSALWLFPTGLWVSLQCVMMLFPDHTHLPFFTQFILINPSKTIINTISRESNSC